MNVACAVGIPGLFGVEGIQRYAEKNANVHVSFSELPDALCDSLVCGGFFDVGITIQPADGLSSADLISSPGMIWVNVDNPLSSRESLTYEDIVDQRIAMPGKDFRVYDNLLKGFAERGLEKPDIVEYAEMSWTYYFVISGKGLGWTVPHLAELDIFMSSDRVVAIPFEGFSWQVCFTWPEGRSLTAHERGYLASLQNEAKRLKGR